MRVACGHGFILDCSHPVGLASVARSASHVSNPVLVAISAI